MRTYSVNSRLAERHDITVLTSTYSGARRRITRDGVKYRRLGLRIPGFGLSPHLSFMAALGPVVARTPHDLVVEEFTPPFGFNGLPWWTRAPVVLIVQWYFFQQWETRYHLPFSNWMKRLARSDRYPHIIVQSDAMRRELQSFLPNARFEKIPPGIDSQAFAGEPQEGSYALFLGRIDIAHKGLDLLIEAWKSMGTSSSIPLIIAGEGPDRNELSTRIGEAGLSSSIRFVGRVEGDEKVKLVAGSRFLVMPSRYETFGLSALEAMASAKPVVCFDIPHLNEVARAPWAIQVPPFDVSAFGRSVSELWLRPQQCLEMGAQAQNEARRYHWDRIAQAQEDFYLEAFYSSHEKT